MANGMKILETTKKITNWSLELGYPLGIRSRPYPTRVFDSGEHAALIIYLMLSEEDMDYNCQGTDQGFKVLMSMPGDDIKLWQNSFRVPILTDAQITIKPELVTTSDGLHSYRPSLRKCFFTGERQLKFYQIYTQHNCERECLANFTKAVCDCVKFNMPSKNFYEN